MPPERKHEETSELERRYLELIKRYKLAVKKEPGYFKMPTFLRDVPSRATNRS